MVETLHGLSSMTGEGIRFADASIGPHGIGIDGEHEFFVWPDSGMASTSETMSWNRWRGLAAGFMDRPQPISNIKDLEQDHQFPPIGRLDAPIVEMNRVNPTKTLGSQPLHFADSTIVQMGSGRDSIASQTDAEISHWTYAEIYQIAPRIHGPSGEFIIAGGVTWYIVPVADEPVDQAVATFEIASTESAELTDALTDLEEIVEEAEEKGFTIPTRTSIQLAEQLLYAMYAVSPRRFEIYPMPRGDIAIDARDGHGRRIIVFCEPGGSMRCTINDNGKRDSHSESDPQGNVGPFIRGALEAFL